MVFGKEGNMSEKNLIDRFSTIYTIPLNLARHCVSLLL